MGLETKCKARMDDLLIEGRLHVDSTSLEFSGSGIKWAIKLGATVRTKVEEGWLVVAKGKTHGAFELGSEAEKWSKKINNPPSRSQKLGLRKGLTCWISGEFEDNFINEIGMAGATIVKKLDDCQLAFLLLDSMSDLAKLSQTVKQLPPKASIWLIWPKGDATLTQNEVMTQAVDCGMGPSKVAAFDKRLTAMRYSKK